MFYKNKSRPIGWRQESERHSLSAQGVPTGKKSVMGGTASLIGEGIFAPLDEPQDSVYADADRVVGDEWSTPWKAEGELPSLVEDFSEPETEELPSLISKEDVGESPLGLTPSSARLQEQEARMSESEKVKQEVAEAAETAKADWKQEAADKTKKIVGAIRKFYFSSDAERLEDEVSNLEKHKLLYKDKVELLNRLRKRVMSDKHSDDTHMQEQFRQLESVDEQLGGMLSELNRLELHERDAKMKLNGLLRQRDSGVKPEKRFTVFPRLSEVFGLPPKTR